MKIKIWTVIMAVTSLIYIVWRGLFTLPLEYGLVAMIVGIALFVSEIISMLEALVQLIGLSFKRNVKLPEVPNEEYPDIDVLIATHSESPELLFKTVNGCLHMDYPDMSKVHIYLCDDGNRESIAKLASTMNVGYFPLADNKEAKAGNLNNALSKTNSPLVATFDADMIPRSSFLMETVRYFFIPTMVYENGAWRKKTDNEIKNGEKIGFVQTPQSFYNPDLFQFNFYAENNIPNEQDYFFTHVNVGRNGTNSPIYAGSNTLINRVALEEVGGIRTKTITEDFATGIDIQAKGYTCYGTSEALASGLAPDDLPNLIKQRQRWGRGCVQTIRSFNFFKSELPFWSKLSYLSCLLYWWTFMRRIVYILSPILFAVFGVIAVKVDAFGILFIWLPSYIIYNYAIRITSGKTRDQKWNNIVDTILAPYLIIPIFLETIGVRMKKFIVTGKDKKNSKSAKLVYAIPHIILFLATCVGLFFSVRNLLIYRNLIGVVALFWLFLNGYFLAMAIFFMTGRINFRSSERFVARIPITIRNGEYDIKGYTSDISEKGFSFKIGFPEYIMPDAVFSLEDGKWPVSISGEVVHVQRFGNDWKYSVSVNELELEEKKTFYELVYDRRPTLATEIKTNAIKDVTNFVKRKTSKDMPSNRRLPRIVIHKEIMIDERQKVVLEDFNYRYVILSGCDKKHIKLPLSNDIKLKLSRLDKQNSVGTLYEVDNWETYAGSLALKKALEALV